MGRVGVIVNPVSGTDVRRVFSTAGFMDNMQKARILRGILAGIESTGVREVLVMPDFYGVAEYGVRQYLKNGGTMEAVFIDMEVEGDPSDTVRAVEIMVREGVGSIVLLGGDGTVRLASKVSRDTPLVPVSTGTNNVIPFSIDGTLAGMAAGAVAEGLVGPGALIRMKRIEVYVDGVYVDHALVDAAGTKYPFKGSRAIIDVGMVTDAVVAYAPPDSIGLASIAAAVNPVSARDDFGVYFRVGGGRRVRAVLAPGVVRNVLVNGVSRVKLETPVELEDPLTVELDGEREIPVYGGLVFAKITRRGPLIVDVRKALVELYKAWNG